MKYVFAILMLSACAYDPELQAHLEAERDFAYHQYYDPEFISDCEYYESLKCGFEQ